MMNIRIKQITVMLSTVFLANCAQAELSMTGQPVAQIGWGDSLQQRGFNHIEDSQQVAQESQYYQQGYNSEVTTTYVEPATITYNNESNTYSNESSNNYGSSYNQNNTNGYATSNDYSNNSYGNNNYSSNNNTDYYKKLFLITKSRSAIVYDVISGKPLYEKQSNVARPIASISKIMTAMVVLDAGLNMHEEIKLTSFDFAGNGFTKTSSSKMKTGDYLTRSEMLLMTLMKSENPAAKSLARTYPGGYNAFMDAMNQKAKNLGMYNTNFGDPTGLDVRNKASAQDLVKLFQAAGNYDIIRRYSTTPSYNFKVNNSRLGSRTLNARNTSRFVRDGSYPIGLSKTGFIREAGKCMALETNFNNRPAIVVVLGAQSYGHRNTDIANILASLKNNF